MIDYNLLYSTAREQFYKETEAEDTFEEWLQKDTVVDHILEALLVRVDSQYWLINEFNYLDNASEVNQKFFEAAVKAKEV
jgi:hypothetical protein